MSDHETPSLSSRDYLLKSMNALGVQSEVQLTLPIEKRASKRANRLLIRKQKSLESVFNLALDYAPESSTYEEIDIDWLARFLLYAEHVSSKPMQKLWAKILAFESARPGSFSLRTLRILSQLTFREANILRRAQSLTCRDPRALSYKIITGYYAVPSMFNWVTLDKPASLPLHKYGLSYTDLLTLTNLEILYPTAIETPLKNTSLRILFGQDTHTLTAKRRQLVLTYYKFTAQGEELLKLMPAQPNPEFINNTLDRFSRHFDIS